MDRIDGQDRQIDAYMVRWMDEQMDRQIDGQIYNLPEPRQDEKANDSVDNADYDIEEAAEDGWEQQLLTLVLKVVITSRKKSNNSIK